MSPTLIDALLLLVVLLGAWAGVRRGFLLAALQLATLIASLVLALASYPWLAAWLAEYLPAVGVRSAPAAFVAVFIATHILAGALARRLSLSLPQRAHQHAANRSLGVLPGVASGLINALLVAMLVQTAPLTDSISAAARDSELAQLFTEPASLVEAELTPIFDPAVRSTLRAFTAPQEPHASVPLHFRVSDARTRPDLEAGMLVLVNQERVRQGLRPLRADPEIAEVARAHSRDMLARGYFAHASPDGVDMAQRLKSAKVTYLVAGENLAYAQTLQAAHTGLMKSPGHRANILRPQFTRVGIAVLDSGKFGLMVTQNFRN
ncbi:hypothetical protein GHT07_19935 [Caenimonas koreensis DSM 17982]|uniref:SCP domain-containing protein n=1 Tax=Caenimonas koreensis DSM 17982 TaxID=1121255 RepID=A0A844BGG6_9BURK|nr:CvpA family protein [Caenimonas koreensis]MRD49551.1 hypothetical protein [Caenimonas koreensis DSM 17982]